MMTKKVASKLFIFGADSRMKAVYNALTIKIHNGISICTFV